MLTHKQKILLSAIQKAISETGVSPSYDEMKDAVGLASKSGIHRLITALEERGYLRRLPNKARAIELTEKVSDALPNRISDADALLSKVAQCAPAIDALPGDVAHALIDHVKGIAA